MTNIKAYLQELADILTLISVEEELATTGSERRNLFAQKRAFAKEYHELIDKHLGEGITITEEDLAELRQAGEKLREAEIAQAFLFGLIDVIGILAGKTA
jgi:hypothetical protein